jgi:hypothetical protein
LTSYSQQVKERRKKKCEYIHRYYSIKNLHISHFIRYLNIRCTWFYLLLIEELICLQQSFEYKYSKFISVWKKKTKDKQQIITYPKKKWWDKIYEILRMVQRTGETKEGRQADRHAQNEKIDDWKIVDPVVSTIRTPIDS